MLTATTSSTAASSTAGASSGTSATNAAASQDRFLKLLVAQLNNQDPMNPMDNAQMTSQMAQMSTVSGIEQVNATLKSMADQFNTMQMLQGSNMVGHSVLVNGNTLIPNNGVAVGAVDLAAPAESVKVEIYSPGGQLLDTINAGALGAGRQYFSWDASNYTGQGNPTFKVTATAGGKAVDATTYTEDKVLSVGTVNGAMNLQLVGLGSTSYSQIAAVL